MTNLRFLRLQNPKGAYTNPVTGNRRLVALPYAYHEKEVGRSAVAYHCIIAALFAAQLCSASRNRNKQAVR